MIKRPFYNILSFTIPLTILSICLATQNIWWGSDTTILASDGFHQYAIFSTTLRNILHGQDSLFYSFSSGLGINFYALISYYLGSFLSPLVYFFDAGSMADATYLFTLVKIGLTGLSTFVSLSTIYPKINKWLVLILSTSFALMSFSMGQIEITMWLDVFILIPLILLGLHKLLYTKSYWLYFTSLSILFIQNYYFGFMTAIFVTLWFLTQLSWNFKKSWKKIGDFIIMSLLAGLTSSIMLLPTYLDLKTHGETLTTLSRMVTENSWYLDIFAKNFIGSYDTTKFGSIPTIYIGLLPLILALTFFRISSIKWQVKLAYGLTISFIIASFYLEPLDLFWQGMHAPNMFLHRYSWVFSVIILFMSAETLSRLEELTVKHMIPAFVLLTIGFSATATFNHHYDFLSIENIALTGLFLLAYLIVFISFYTKQVSTFLYISFTLLFTLAEISFNTYYQLSGLNNDWHFPSREGYTRHIDNIDTLVKNSAKQKTSFYRTELLLPQTGNDSMKFGYNGISQFSSVRNRKASQLLDKLGFRSDGTNLNLRYQNNTLIADSLFAVRDNLSRDEVTKYGFSFIDRVGQTSLYHNTYASQLAILTSQPYQDIDITVNTLDNQTKWLNSLSGLELSYFKRLDSHSQELTEIDKQLVKTVKNSNGSSSAHFTIQVTANSQVYLSLPPITSSNSDNMSTQIKIDGNITEYTRDNAFSLFDLGYYDHARELNIELIFPDTNEVSFIKPNVYALDTLAYEQAMTNIKARDVHVTTRKNQVLITYSSPRDASLVVTLPYDKGWTAVQDGQKLPVKAANEGFILLDAKAGQGKITLTFVPHGFKTGLILSLIGLSLGVSVCLSKSAQQKRLEIDSVNDSANLSLL